MVSQVVCINLSSDTWSKTSSVDASFVKHVEERFLIFKQITRITEEDDRFISSINLLFVKRGESRHFHTSGTDRSHIGQSYSVDN